MKNNKALEQTILFISVFTIFFTIMISIDLREQMLKTDAFIANLEFNQELVELIGKGYEVNAVETEGNDYNPTIHTYISHMGFDFFVEMKYKKVTQIDLIVQCKKDIKTSKRTCYHQTLYPEKSVIFKH